MKRVFVLVMFCGWTLCSLSAQELAPSDLKNARYAVYEWISDYGVYAKCVGRDARSNFYSLFEGNEVEIYNDYFPMSDYDFHHPTISVREYVELVRNKENYYEMKFRITNGTIQTEEYDSGVILFEVTFDKEVWFVQRGDISDDRYEYPSRQLQMTVSLKYIVSSSVIVATELICKNPVSEFVVLHENGSNSFEDHASVNSLCVLRSTKLVHYKSKSNDYDAKMIEIVGDTIKNYLGFGYATGKENIYAPISDTRFTYYDIRGDLQQSMWISFYRQLILKQSYRSGFEVSLMYKNSSSIAEADYNERYSAIDPDGGMYDRIIEGVSYKESVMRNILELPLAFKYEYLFTDNISAFAKLGASFVFDLSRSVKATADMEYSGYYDWLYDLTIDQNGIYDFGNFSLAQTSTELGFNKLSVDGFGAIGCCFYLFDNWMVELSMCYRNSLWRRVDVLDDYHMSGYDGDWTSISYIQDKYFTNIFNISLQINYNF